MRFWKYVGSARVFLVVAILVLQTFVAPSMTEVAVAQAQPTDQNLTTRSVSVSGSGQVSVQPDEAVIRVGVETSDVEASAALNANSEQMQSLIDALLEAGVAQEDIQTQTIQLQPQYAGTPEEGPPQPLQMRETPEITGYTAINTVEVRARDLANLGSLLDSVVAAGGNQIAGIRFEVTNSADALATARETAWNDAQQKAEQLASLAGAELGNVLSMNEFSRGPIPYAETSLAARDAGVPVQPGTQDVGVELQVTWQLQ